MDDDSNHAPRALPLADAVRQFLKEHAGEVEVEWGTPASDSDLEGIEAKLGLSIPAPYRRFIADVGAVRLTTRLENWGGSLTVLGHGDLPLRLGEASSDRLPPQLGACFMWVDDVSSVRAYALGRDGQFYTVSNGTLLGRGSPEFDRFATFLLPLSRDLREKKAHTALNELSKELGDRIRLEAAGPMSATELAEHQASSGFALPLGYLRFLRLVGPVTLRGPASHFPNELTVRGLGATGRHETSPICAVDSDEPGKEVRVLPVLTARELERVEAEVHAIDGVGNVWGLEGRTAHFFGMTSGRGFDWHFKKLLKLFGEAARRPELEAFLDEVVAEQDGVALRLGTPASETQIRAFEATCGFALPDDYRRFLRRFGALKVGDVLLPGAGSGELDALRCFSGERARVRALGHSAVVCVAREEHDEDFKVLTCSGVRCFAGLSLARASPSSETYSDAVFEALKHVLSDRGVAGPQRAHAPPSRSGE